MRLASGQKSLLIMLEGHTFSYPTRHGQISIVSPGAKLRDGETLQKAAFPVWQAVEKRLRWAICGVARCSLPRLST